MGCNIWTWNTEWVNNEKRKKRYNIFQGELVYFFFGIIDKFEIPSSMEGDVWQDPKNNLIEISELIDISTRQLNKKSIIENDYQYKMKQLIILKSLKICMQIWRIFKL